MKNSEKGEETREKKTREVRETAALIDARSGGIKARRRPWVLCIQEGKKGSQNRR